MVRMGVRLASDATIALLVLHMSARRTRSSASRPCVWVSARRKAVRSRASSWLQPSEPSTSNASAIPRSGERGVPVTHQRWRARMLAHIFASNDALVERDCTDCASSMTSLQKVRCRSGVLSRSRLPPGRRRAAAASETLLDSPSPPYHTSCCSTPNVVSTSHARSKAPRSASWAAPRHQRSPRSRKPV